MMKASKKIQLRPAHRLSAVKNTLCGPQVVSSLTCLLTKEDKAMGKLNFGTIELVIGRTNEKSENYVIFQ